LEVRPYPDELTSGDEEKKAFGSACGEQIIAHLLAIQLYLLGCGIDVRFPVDDEVNQSDRLIRNRVCYSADIRSYRRILVTA